MKTRIVTGTVLTVLTAGIFFAAYFFNPVINIFALLISIAAIYECFKVAGLMKYRAFPVIALAYDIFFSLFVFFFNTDGDYYKLLMLLTLTALAAYIVAAILYRAKDRCSFAETAEASFITFYVTVGFGASVMLYESYSNVLSGLFTVAAALFGAWMCDVGGWLFGITMGRHKLCPTISPKKSVEGLAGSVVFSFILLVSLSFISRAVLVKPLNLTVMLCCAFPMAIFELFGDLIASVLKREHGVKDFGTILPAHGGIMDRFDGYLMTSIFLFAVSKFVGLF